MLKKVLVNKSLYCLELKSCTCILEEIIISIDLGIMNLMPAESSLGLTLMLSAEASHTLNRQEPSMYLTEHNFLLLSCSPRRFCGFMSKIRQELFALTRELQMSS